MGRILQCTVLLFTCVLLTSGQEFKRMPDFRGQSFGLENFLLQPFNLASQTEDERPPPPPPPSKRREHARPNPFTVEFQLHNDGFDMKKMNPTMNRAPFLFTQANSDFKPVHEPPELNLPPPQRKLPPEENLGYERPTRQRLPPDTRRPLEKPSEFILSINENESQQSPQETSPERQRKRVMKRRRKKPSTPQPQLDEQLKHEEIHVNVYQETEGAPTSFQETMKEFPIPLQESNSAIEHRPIRKKPGGFRRRDPFSTTPASQEVLINQDDKLVSEASQNVAELLPGENKTPELTLSTTDNPGESTKKLKTLLKQQNGQLSLSELLQTQNLSLADFLKGNPGALSALGANKVHDEKITSTTFIPEPASEKPKLEPQRTHIPKISPKSRPFSKPLASSNKRRPVTTEEPVQDLPKQLQIIEVTSDKPSYNGFMPKNPRTRGSQKAENKPINNYSREKISESTFESKHEDDEVESEKESEESFEMVRTTPKSPGLRLTTPSVLKEPTITEQRVVPKRYGDYKPKVRIDRRKPTTPGTTEATTVTEALETTVKYSSSTEQIRTTKDPKNRVRIPFMSVNNPEISVILPNKKVNTTTEKYRTSPVIKDRINLFKRLNSEENQVNENTVELKDLEATETTSTTSMPTTSTSVPIKTNGNAPETTAKHDLDGKESSDEIVELLRNGNNAERLQRILASRNMTLSELLEKRANSSKQPNVTDLFEKQVDSTFSGKTQIMELEDNFHPTTDQVTSVVTTKKLLIANSDFSKSNNNNNKSQELSRNKSGINKLQDTNSFDHLFVDESIIQPVKVSFEKEETREPKTYERNPVKENVQKPSQREHLNLSPGMQDRVKYSVPMWNMDEKPIYGSNPYGYPTYDLNKNLAGVRTTTEKTKAADTEEETIILETVSRNLDSNNRLKTSINGILKEQVEQVEVVSDEKAFLPPAVKSAIIASGVVMGIALIVFVAIFATCGWKQRQFRLRARSSILNDSLNGSERKTIRRTGTLSPVSFKRSSLYKKSIDFEDTESSISGSSNTSSYLWNTLKHTFQSRNSTLKNRQEKEEKIQERENRSRRNTLTQHEIRDKSREDDRTRKQSMAREDHRRDSFITHNSDRRNTLSRDDNRRDSLMSRDTLSRDLTRDSIISRDTLSREFGREESRRGYREENRRLTNLLRENERCSFKKIDPDRTIIQTSVNFKRGGFNSSSRHFDTCDHFN